MKTRLFNTCAVLVRLILLAALTTGGAAPAAAQPPTTGAAAPASRSARDEASQTILIQGQVVDPTGPVGAGLRVQALLPNSEVIAGEAQTDPGGRYSFLPLPAGYYQLRVVDQDNQPLALAENSGVEVIPDEASQPREHNLVLAAPASGITEATPELQTVLIRGQVLGPQGPMGEGLRVQVTQPDGDAVLDETFTGPDGKYAFRPIPVGRYRLQVLDQQGQLLALDASSAADVQPGEAEQPVEHDLMVAASGQGEPAPAGPEVATEGQPAATPAVFVIRGWVRDVEGLSVEGLRVQALQPHSDIVLDETHTDADGRYTFRPLPTGQYWLQVVDRDGRPLEFMEDKGVEVSPEEAEHPVEHDLLVRVPAAGAVGALAEPSPTPAAGLVAIHGQVLAADGTPGARLRIQAVRPHTNLVVDETLSDLSGQYAFRLLPASRDDPAGRLYWLQVRDLDGRLLALDPNSAAEVQANESEQPMGHDLALAAPAFALIPAPAGVSIQATGQITGIVTAADTGQPLSDVIVGAYSVVTETIVTTATTDSAGQYTLTVLAGSYKVGFAPPDGSPYLPEFYNNKASHAAATSVSVADGTTTTYINAALELGGQIKGQVTAADSGAPLSNVIVRFYDRTGTVVNAKPTDPSGTYTITGLAEGGYRVEFNRNTNLDYFTEFYNNKTTLTDADVINISANSVLNNFNADLDRGGQITGTVTAADTGQPLPYAVGVTVYNSSGSFAGSTSTNASGAYTLTRLATGSYRLRFDRGSNTAYLSEFYNNKPDSLGAADPIVVSVNHTYNVNAALDRGGSIAGRVIAADTLLPLQNVYITVYNSADTPVSSGTTNAAGFYTTTTGLPTGNYRIYFNRGNNTAYFSEYYSQTASLETATVITVSANAVTSGIDAALDKGGLIAGQVTAADTGLPLAGVAVYVYNSNDTQVDSTTTNAGGRYTTTIGLPAGGYRAWFYRGGNTAYLSEYYSQTYTLATATVFTVNVNSVKTGINVTLDRGGVIWGRVTAADTGLLLPSTVRVNIIDSNNNTVDTEYAYSFEDGYYTTTIGLPPGGYRVKFDRYTNYAYLTEYYSDTYDLATATIITLTTIGQVVSDTNAALDLGGVIWGRVTASFDASPGQEPQFDTRIRIYDSADQQVGFNYYTNLDGFYTTTVGLPPGGYRVRFEPDSYYSPEFLPEYYDKKLTLAEADVITLTLGQVMSDTDAMLHRGGRISGIVFAGDTISGTLSDVRVYTYDANGFYAAPWPYYTVTDASGVYTITNLPAGGYRLKFETASTPASDYFTEWWDDKPSLATANTVVAALDIDLEDINPVLDRGGRIAGVVTAADTSTALQDVYVTAYGSNTYSDFTDSAGVYTITNLTAGGYRVKFDRYTNSDYLSEYYNNQPNVVAADVITVSLNSAPVFADADLERGGKISGVVKAIGTGALLPDVYVTVYNSDDQPVYYLPGINPSNGSGYYEIRGLAPGNYRVRFGPLTFGASSNYLPQFYSHKPDDLTAADPISVTIASDINVDAVLDLGGQIAGVVTAADGGAPLEDVQVVADPTGSGSSKYAYTDASGVYTITGLTPGGYQIAFYPLDPGPSSDYLPEFYDNQSAQNAAQVIQVSTNEVVSNINAGLDKGGRIAGVVTASDTNSPLQNVYVRVYDNADDQVGYDYSDASGVYTITPALPPGGYRLEFDPPSGYLGEYYNNKSDREAADVIMLSLGSVVSGTNAVIDKGGQIAGVVTAADAGDPLSNVHVTVYNSAGAEVGQDDYTDASGVYTVTTLPTGDYRLRFTPPSYAPNSVYLEEYYNDQPRLLTAEVIPVSVNQVVGGKDAALDKGGQIAGQVTAADTGLPLEDVYVQVYDSLGTGVEYGYTDANGLYTTTTGLPAGAYRVWFDRYVNYAYFSEYYNQKPNLAAATVITVSNNIVTTGVNAALDKGGQIAGRVTAADTGLPLEDVRIYVYDSSGAQVGSFVSTDADGLYTTTAGLATGGYRVRFDPYTNNDYLTEYYSKTYNLPAATVITVTAPGVAGNINAALDKGGQITGLVTAADTGDPVAYVNVYVYDSNGAQVDSEFADFAGTYTIVGLPAGDYRVKFDPQYAYPSGYAEEFWDNKSSPLTADVIAVSLNSPAVVRDAVLDKGGQITGKVTAAGTGAPLEDVYVTAYDATGSYVDSAFTNELGTYGLGGLTAGQYRLRFDAPSGYLDEYYNNRSSLETADPITVTLGNETSGIDAALDKGGQIAGVVKAAGTNLPLQGVSVDVYDLNGARLSSASTSTNAAGAYTTGALVPGGYRLRFTPPINSGYIREYYDNRASLTAATVITVSNNNVISNTNAVLERGGLISGTVTAADTGNFLSNVYVKAYDSQQTLAASGYTDVSGTYTVTGLATGSYRLEFDPNTNVAYFLEAYDNRSNLDLGDAISVTTPNTTPNINAALEHGGQISGTVTADGNGLPLDDVFVGVYDAAGTQVGYDYTDASGFYATTAVAAGGYHVQFSPPDYSSYLAEYYDDQSTFDGADVVSVTVPAGASNVNAALARGGRITGAVTAADTGFALPYPTVRVYDSSGDYLYSSVDGSGAYLTPPLPAGIYRLEFAAYDYITEYYDDQTTLAAALGISVSLNSTVENINATLEHGGRIAGVVTAADTGQPLEDVYVTAFDNTGTLVDNTTTDDKGVYLLTGLRAGDYRVRFDQCYYYYCYYYYAYTDYLPEYYNNKPARVPYNPADLAAADVIPVSLNSTVTDINAALERGGQITGKVTAADTGQPLQNMSVYAYDVNDDIVATDATDPAGVYLITGLPTGGYRLYFAGSSSYIGEYYDNQSSLGTANTISVTAPNVVSNINAALEPGGKIAGVVTDADTGSPVQGVTVRVYYAGSSSQAASVSTNASGVYTTTALVAGGYQVEFDPPSSSTYIPEYYNNQPLLAAGDVINVSTNSVRSGVNAALDKGGRITGTVTAAGTGLPLPNVAVKVYDRADTVVGTGTTDASGRYATTPLTTATLPGGGYRVRFIPPLGSDYVQEYYSNTVTLAAAQAISLTAPNVVPNINAALDKGGRITGAVTAAGAPLPGVIAKVYDSAGSLVPGSNATDAFGVYTTTALTPGSYRLWFEPSQYYSTNYLPEYFDNQPTLISATVVTVTGTNVITGINAALETGSRITGTVTAADGLSPLQNVFVRVYDSQGTQVEYDYTDVFGRYTSPALPAGGYRVKFDPPLPAPPLDTTYAFEYYDDQPTLAAATVITLTPPVNAENINAALGPGGRIMGQVTAADTGLPLENVDVLIYDSAGVYIGDANTDASGAYTTPPLPSGNYRLKFDDYGPYISEYYNNRSTLATANLIQVNAPDSVPNINAVLDLGGRITGTVTAADTGDPLPGAVARVYRYDCGGFYSQVASALTDAAGTYTTTAITPGSYRVWFDRYANTAYLSEYYSDRPDLGTADVVNVSANGLVSNISAALDRGGQIMGMVTAGDTSLPLANVYVSVYDSASAQVGNGYTDASGVYTTTAVAAGGYRMKFDRNTNTSYLSEYYDDQPSLAAADVITLSLGSLVTGTDAVLAAGGQIAGMVTAADTGDPLEDVYVWVYDGAGAQVGSGSTDATGIYTTTAVAAGSYKVEFDPYTSGSARAYVAEYYDDQPDSASADPVVLTTTVTTGIDAALTRGSQITGRVTQEDGSTALSNVYVRVYDSNDEVVGSGYTDESGNYVTTGLPTGSYRVQFDPYYYYYYYYYYYASAYLPEYYNNQITLAAAELISVTAPVAASNINAALALGGKITGIVTAEDTGLPLSGVRVTVYDSTDTVVRMAYTDNAGVYTIVGLPSGNYRVRFEGYALDTDSGCKSYDTIYYNQKPDLASADAVGVTAPDVTRNINAVMPFTGATGITFTLYLPLITR